MRYLVCLFPLFLLTFSSCVTDENGQVTLKPEVLSSQMITGFDDGRKMVASIEDVNHSTVAIMRNGQTICTGTTFGLSHVITAAHCVYDSDKREIKEGVTVNPGLHMGLNYRPSGRFKIKRVFLLKSYTNELKKKGYTNFAASQDIAVLQVLEYEGNKYFSEFSPSIEVGSSMDLSLSQDSFNTVAYTVSEGKKINSQYYQSPCHSRGRRGSLDAYYHSCDTGPSSSGMGLIQGSRLMGIHTGGVSSQGLNSAAMITDPILADLMNIKRYEFDGLNLFEVFLVKPEPYFGLTLQNNCDQKVKAQVGFRGLDGEFYVTDRVDVNPNEFHFAPVKAKEREIYVRASSQDHRFIWEGDSYLKIDGQKYAFLKTNLKGTFLDGNIKFSCD